MLEISVENSTEGEEGALPTVITYNFSNNSMESFSNNCLGELESVDLSKQYPTQNTTN